MEERGSYSSLPHSTFDLTMGNEAMGFSTHRGSHHFRRWEFVDDKTHRTPRWVRWLWSDGFCFGNISVARSLDRSNARSNKIESKQSS